MQKYFVDGDKSQWWMARFFDTNKGGSYPVLDYHLETGTWMLDAFYGAALQSMVEYQAEVNRIFDEMVVKIIIGDEPLDSFDKYVDQMMKAGLEKITADVNEWKNKK